MTLTKADFLEFISNGARNISLRELHKLIADLPDLREQFAKLRTSSHPDSEHQLHFLSGIVEDVWTEKYLDMPHAAALEAAFAVAYFSRETDLIPDFLGPIGLVDDVAIIQTVLARNSEAYSAYCSDRGGNWSEIKPDTSVKRATPCSL